MKKYLGILLMMLFSLTAYAQEEIPNFDMENWDSVSYDKPSQWPFLLGRIKKETPPHSGNWACKLQNDSLGHNPGVIMYGYSHDGVNFFGGIPFPARPDSVACYIKYNIPAGDTAYILVYLKKNGGIVGLNYEKLAYGSSLSYVKYALKINYLSGLIPDSLIFAVTCTDPGGTLPLGGYLIIDDIEFKYSLISGPQLPNGDFESWDPPVIVYNPQGWINPDFYGALTGHPAITKTTDKYSGNYALKAQNFILTPDTIWGGTCTPSPYDPWQQEPAFPVSKRYQYLTFYYKFFPQNNDTMNVFIVFFKSGVIIGWGGFSTSATVNAYTKAIAPINYSVPDVPDSAKMYIMAFQQKPRGNSILYIDSLHLDTSMTVSARFAEIKSVLAVYPNPARDRVTVTVENYSNDYVDLSIFDVLGNEIAVLNRGTLLQGRHEFYFDTQSLSRGIYFCRLISGSAESVKKIIVTD